MTYQYDFTLPAEFLEQIAVEGFEVLPDLIRIVVNTAMLPFSHAPLLPYSSALFFPTLVLIPKVV